MTTTTEVCASCHEPLLVEVEPDSEDDERETAGSAGKATSNTDHSNVVLDDVGLSCGCHFHWECFLDSATITQCPACSRDISSLGSSNADGQRQQQVLVTIRNEGGTQHDFDILPSATEEAYLRAYPEERRGHALLEFVREGDIDAVVCLLLEEDDDDDDEVDVLRYCGTFEGVEGSALHVAVRYGREEVAWLLLALGSSLAWEEFPPGAVQALERVGVKQEDRRAEPDVRGVRDSEGRLPVQVAGTVGGIWTKWVESGKLNCP